MAAINSSKKVYQLYDYIIIILALVSISLVILDFASVIRLSAPPFLYIENGILIVFAIDYFYRLYKAPDKKYFFRDNIFDLIAIIPFYSLFSFFRIARVFRITQISRLASLSHLVGVTGKLTNSLTDFLSTNKFSYVIYFSIVVILVSSSMYSYAENVTFRDAIWWALVTATTVGYGDIAPDSQMGRFAAMLLMILGIGFIGALTSTITEYFNKKKYKIQGSDIEDLTKQLEHLTNKIDNLEYLLKKAEQDKIERDR